MDNITYTWDVYELQLRTTVEVNTLRVYWSKVGSTDAGVSGTYAIFTDFNFDAATMKPVSSYTEEELLTMVQAEITPEQMLSIDKAIQFQIENQLYPFVPQPLPWAEALTQ